MTHPKNSIEICGFSGGAVPEKINMFCFKTKCDYFMWLQDSIFLLAIYADSNSVQFK